MKRLLRLRASLLVFFTHRLVFPIVVAITRPPCFPYTYNQLKSLPDHTTGAALLRFLEQHHSHFLRHFEKHDLKHLIWNYPPTETGEVCLQSFMLAKGQRSFEVIATVVAGLLFMPDKWHLMYAAWRRGKNTSPLQHINWASLIERPLEDVCAELTH